MNGAALNQDAVLGRLPLGARRTRDNRDALTLIALSLPPLAVIWLLAHTGSNTEIEIPVQHFLIGTAVSMIALTLAGALALAAVQIAAYRVLMLAIGFMAMAGLFTVHALATPGILLPSTDEYASGSVIQISAFLSLAVPAVFFAGSYTGASAVLDRRLPFFP